MPQTKPVLHPNALHGLAGQFLALLDGQTEAHPAAILLQFLALFGNVIGRTAHICIGPSKHFLNLFLLLVGITGSGRKGHSLAEAKRLFAVVVQEWLRTRAMDGIESGQALVWYVRDEQQRGKEFDPGVEDKRLFLIEQEFGGIFARINSPGSIGRVLQKQICKAWDSPEVMDSGGKTSPAKATGAHISIVGHITADELRGTLSSRTDGFMNRFLLVWTEKGPALSHGGHVDPAGLVQLANALQDRIAFAQTIRQMVFSEDAEVEWDQAYTHSLYHGPGGVVGALTERGAPYVMRLAALYALLDGVEQIEVAHLDAALAIWQYCVDSARFVFKEATGNPIADRILEALEASKNGKLTFEEIRKLLSHKDPEQRRSAVELLKESGKVTVAEEPGKGRPSTIVQLTAITA